MTDLAGLHGPDFERVVVRSADDPVTGKLQTRDHMIIMAPQDLR